jgi:hypothetical protein
MTAHFCWIRSGPDNRLTPQLFYVAAPMTDLNGKARKEIVQKYELTEADYAAVESRDRSKYPNSLDLLAERYPAPEKNQK